LTHWWDSGTSKLQELRQIENEAFPQPAGHHGDIGGAVGHLLPSTPGINCTIKILFQKQNIYIYI
jgi:hypothetical protein